MPDLFTAALGGTVVAIFTAAARAAGIPGDVRVHDATIRERDEALGTWVADRNVALERECTPLRFGLQPPPDVTVPRGPDRYGDDPHEHWESAARDIDVKVAKARTLALHEYRDEARRAQLDVMHTMANENWPHRVYRKWWRRPAPTLTTPDRAAPVLDSWRKQSSMNPGRPVWPDDATARTLEDAVANVRALGP